MKHQMRWCLITALIAVILAGVVLSAFPEPAQAWRANKVWVNLRVHNRYWATWPPPNDVRILAGGWQWDGWGWRWYRPAVQAEWTNYYPGHWWYWWDGWTVKKYGHRDTYYCQWAWACTGFRTPPWSMLFYRWDWTRSCNYYRPGGGWAWRWSSTPKVFLPDSSTVPVFADSNSTQYRGELLTAFVRVDSVQWANSPIPIEIDELTLTGTQGLSWTSPTSLAIINQGDSLSFPEADALDPPEVGGPTVVVKGKFQTAADDPDSLGHWTNFVMQFEEEPDLPATSTWGIVVLTVGLVTVVLLLVARRRRVHANA